MKGTVESGNFGLAVGQSLSKGSTSRVYEGTYEGIACAVKVLSRKNAELSKEADILNQIKHDSCTRLYKKIGNKKYIIMELAKGEELYRYVTEMGGLSSNATHEIAKQLVDALDHIHSQRIIHRDIKPENVIINPSTLVIKLVDFGCSDVLTEDSYNWVPCGTVSFNPPEFLEAIEITGSRPFRIPVAAAVAADVYAFGLLLFFCLTSCLPWGLYEEVCNVIQQIAITRQLQMKKTSFIELPQTTDPHLGHLISICLAPQTTPSAKDLLCHPAITGKRILTDSHSLDEVVKKQRHTLVATL